MLATESQIGKAVGLDFVVDPVAGDLKPFADVLNREQFRAIGVPFAHITHDVLPETVLIAAELNGNCRQVGHFQGSLPDLTRDEIPVARRQGTPRHPRERSDEAGHLSSRPGAVA